MADEPDYEAIASKHYEDLRRISIEATKQAIANAIEKAFYTDTNPKDGMPLISKKEKNHG